MPAGANTDLFIVEYRWWDAVFIRLLLVVVSILFICAWYLLKDIVGKSGQFDLYVFLAIGVISLSTTFLSSLSLPSVPRLICFREQDIRVVGPLGRQRLFPYADLSRVIIKPDLTWSQVFKRTPFLFGAVLYFYNDTVKVMFNCRGMPDFNKLVAHLRTKAVVIED